MNDLHLSSDGRSSVQSHLDELSKRLTAVIMLVIILTGIWSLSIDEILHYLLGKLDPCEYSCVNIFSPDEWAGTRWLSAAIIGLLTAMPFAIHQAYSFAKPGLLPSERRALIIWMMMMWILAFSSLIFTMTEFLPWLYSYGHSFNNDTGLIGRYDAAEMLRISISIAWAMVLVLAAMSVVTIAGMSKLLWSGNAGWWRLRIHGIMLMLLWLVIPVNLPGLLFTLTLMASGVVELIGWKSFRAPMPIGHGMRELLDGEGGVHRVLYVDCRCCGTSPKISPLKGMGLVEYHAVCRDPEQQDNLLDVVKRFNANKVVLSGCIVESRPIDYIDSLRFLGCSTNTLNLAKISVARTDNSEIDLNLAMACQTNPWSEGSAIERCAALVDGSDITTILYGEVIPFGLNLQTNEAWITNPSDSLIQKMAELGISMKYCSN